MGNIRHEGDETIIEGGIFDGIHSTERIIQGDEVYIGDETI